MLREALAKRKTGRRMRWPIPPARVAASTTFRRDSLPVPMSLPAAAVEYSSSRNASTKLVRTTPQQRPQQRQPGSNPQRMSTPTQGTNGASNKQLRTYIHDLSTLALRTSTVTVAPNTFEPPPLHVATPPPPFASVRAAPTLGGRRFNGSAGPTHVAR